MLLVLYTLLAVLLLYISYKDIKEAQYKNYYFYVILIIISTISIIKNTSFLKIFMIYALLIISYFIRNKYIDKIGDGDIDLYISLSLLYSFETFLCLIIISTLSAIVVNLINNHNKSIKDNTVRLVPYITFAFFIIEIYTYLRGI